MIELLFGRSGGAGARRAPGYTLAPAWKKILKYILCRLETDAGNRACDSETDPGSIEHVLPESPSNEWDQHMPRDRWDALVYRIGNLTLLERSANRRVGNAAYLEKVAAYGQSAYVLTREIPVLAPEQWTLELVESRQARLAQRATHAWSSDFV